MIKRKEALALISYTLGYCTSFSRDIKNITPEEIWEDWCEECINLNKI